MLQIVLSYWEQKEHIRFGYISGLGTKKKFHSGRPAVLSQYESRILADINQQRIEYGSISDTQIARSHILVLESVPDMEVAYDETKHCHIVYSCTTQERSPILQLTSTYISRFMRKFNFTSRDIRSKTSYQTEELFVASQIILVSVWGLCIALNIDNSSDLYSSDPSTHVRFSDKDRHWVAVKRQLNTKYTEGLPPRQQSNESFSTNYLLKSDGSTPNVFLCIKSTRKNSKLPQAIQSHIVQSNMTGVTVSSSHDGWIKDFNELRRVEEYPESDHLKIEICDSGYPNNYGLAKQLLLQKNYIRLFNMPRYTGALSPPDAYIQKAAKMFYNSKYIRFAIESSDRTPAGYLKPPSYTQLVDWTLDLYDHVNTPEIQASNRKAWLWTGIGLPMVRWMNYFYSHNMVVI